MRIIQTRLEGGADLAQLLAAARDKPFSRQAADNLLARLLAGEIISKREHAVVKAMLVGDALKLAEENEDLLRGRLIRLLLMNLIRDDYNDEQN